MFKDREVIAEILRKICWVEKKNKRREKTRPCEPPLGRSKKAYAPTAVLDMWTPVCHFILSSAV